MVRVDWGLPDVYISIIMVRAVVYLMALSNQGVLIVPESMLTWKHQYISSGRPMDMFRGLGVDRPISFLNLLCPS